MIDVNNSLNLTFEEVREYQWYTHPKLFQLLGINSWHSMVAHMDKDGDVKIDRGEFVDYMKNRQKAVKAKTDDQFHNVPEMKTIAPVEPAWKKARTNPVLKGAGKGKGGGKGKDDPNRCWDFDAGYCYRGARCNYTHYTSTQIDQATLDEHHRHCMKLAAEYGVNLSHQAHIELQTLKLEDADALILSLGSGGQNEHVWDKNRFVIASAHTLRMKAGRQAHPDWEWYHGSNKRARHYYSKAAEVKTAKKSTLDELEETGRALEVKYGELFDRIDTSGDGQASRQELRQANALEELGAGSIEEFIEEAGTDGAGKVSRDEFLAYFAHINIDADACYNAIFDDIDVNNSLNLTFKEVREYQWYTLPKLFQLLGINSWHSMVAHMDKDGDGKIDR